MELRVASWNLWGDSCWAERQLSVERMLARITPDVLAVQELSGTSATALDGMLVSHRRAVPDLVGEPPLNVWFNEDQLLCADSGSAAIDEDHGGRATLWARLRIGSGPQTLLVFTTHLTWDDYPDPTVGQATRDRQARRLASLIQSVQHAGEAVVLLADSRR